MNTLIDNSTVTASFRALALIENRIEELFPMDVAALRVLIDAVILADEIVILDDYKPEYSEQRKQWLDYPCIRFQKVADPLNAFLSKHARAHVANWGLQRHLAVDLKGVFDELSVLFRHAWRDSESFIVLKALGGDEKFGSMLLRSYQQNLANAGGKPLDGNPFKARTYNRQTAKVCPCPCLVDSEVGA